MATASTTTKASPRTIRNPWTLTDEVNSSPMFAAPIYQRHPKRSGLNGPMISGIAIVGVAVIAGAGHFLTKPHSQTVAYGGAPASQTSATLPPLTISEPSAPPVKPLAAKAVATARPAQIRPLARAIAPSAAGSGANVSATAPELPSIPAP